MKTVGDIIKKPDKYQNATKDIVSRYKDVGQVDFYDQIYPVFLKEYMETIERGELFSTTFFKNSNIKDENEAFLLGLAYLVFLMFEPAVTKGNFIYYDSLYRDLSGLEKRKDLIGAIVRAANKITNSDNVDYSTRLVTFFKTYGTTFKLRKCIPAKLARKMTGFFQALLEIYADRLNDKDLEKDAKNYKFIPAKDAVAEVKPLPKFISLLNAEKNKLFLVIHNAKINEENEVLNNVIIGSPTTQYICDGIVFDNCYFDCDIRIFGSGIHSRLVFKNCIFNSPFRILSISFKNTVDFENCKFNSFFNIVNARFESLLTFEDCTFYDIRETRIDGCKFNNLESGGLSMKNCVFHSPFSLKKSQTSGKLIIENTAFFDTFDFSEFKFVSEKTTISNIVFNRGRNISKYEKIFANVLKEHNLNQTVISLGLHDEKKENQGFDYDAYQIAYNSGFLKPEYAAYFLGKSKVYLAKKRTDDKKKVVRDSLPFKIDGRDVQYPVEALLAFKAKDWEKLKELRKKYPIPTK